MSESYGQFSNTPDSPELRRNMTGSTSADTDVKETAKAEAKGVVDTAKAEAGGVASEAKSQAKTLFAQTKGELRDQAGKQQQRAAQGLRSAGEELNALASGTPSPNSGIATDLVRQASSRVSGMASWLENRDPESLLTEVKSFARRKPGMFIGLSLVAGVVAGRLTRALAEGNADRKELEAGYPSTGMGAADLSGRPTTDAWAAEGTYGAGIPATAGGTAVGQFDDAPVGESLAAGNEWTDDLSGEGYGDDRRNTNPL